MWRYREELEILSLEKLKNVCIINVFPSSQNDLSSYLLDFNLLRSLVWWLSHLVFSGEKKKWEQR